MSHAPHPAIDSPILLYNWWMSHKVLSMGVEMRLQIFITWQPASLQSSELRLELNLTKEQMWLPHSYSRMYREDATTHNDHKLTFIFWTKSSWPIALPMANPLKYTAFNNAPIYYTGAGTFYLTHRNLCYHFKSILHKRGKSRYNGLCQACPYWALWAEIINA